MKAKWIAIPVAAAVIVAGLLYLKPGAPPDAAGARPLLLRVDDIGMNHATNAALAALADTGMPFSASVMFACPWYQEAVDILKANPRIAVGVHLTLNAEWKHYRWGPVLGPEAVPSLVNDNGYFHSSTAAFLEQGFEPDEVRRELAAQIERALATGLPVEYIDFHMRTAIATPELEQLVTGLAEDYGLRMSMLMGESVKTLFDTPADKKKTDFIEHVRQGLETDKTNLVIIHVAEAHPEMRVLVDLNNPDMNADDGRPLAASHRQAELDMLLSPEVQTLLQQDGIKLVTYKDMPNPFSEKNKPRMDAKKRE